MNYLLDADADRNVVSDRNRPITADAATIVDVITDVVSAVDSEAASAGGLYSFFSSAVAMAADAATTAAITDVDAATAADVAMAFSAAATAADATA